MPRAYAVLFFILAAANVSLYQTLLAPDELTLSVLEAGKGTAVLARTPSGATVLFDAGPDASILRALGEALPPWRRRIDAVVLTSDKKMSVGGLPDVESRYRPSVGIRVGGQAVPYGSPLVFDGVRVEVVSAGIISFSYGPASLLISSSTPKGDYVSDANRLYKR